MTVGDIRLRCWASCTNLRRISLRVPTGVVRAVNHG